jgi:nucleoside-diphosphate-sugar epimerase
MPESNNHALVIGASGLIGWSVVNQLLQCYPAKGTFTRVTALVNRPLDLGDCFWPETTDSTPALDLIPGINLLSTDEELEATLKERVADVASITHVYYFGTSNPW